MTLYILNHSYKYEVDKISRIFFPLTEIKILYEFDSSDTCYIKTQIEGSNVIIEYNNNNLDKETATLKNGDNTEQIICKCLFILLKRVTNTNPQWGMLTGIRPVKLLRNKISEYNCNSLALDYLKLNYFISQQKSNLIEDIYNTQNTIINNSKKNDFSLYISIPFCPSRCSYCTFVSKVTDREGGLITDYLNKLVLEIKHTAAIARQLNLNLKSVYIGGGTPTMLNPQEINELLFVIKTEFIVQNNIEFTFEAGRPDTIDEPKLQAMKENSVTRISVNPQTLNEKSLKAISREHSVEEFYVAYNLVKDYKFNCINIDLIAGLPMDNLETYRETIDKIIKLNPENITLHTLSLKRSSDIDRNSLNNWSESAMAVDMVDYATKKLISNNFIPYYLYRQSRSAAGLENIGFAKQNYIGEYNIYMMEEIHTILACGSNAVSKLVHPYSGKIERIFNYKYTSEYIKGTDELIKRKDGVIKFYE